MSVSFEQADYTVVEGSTETVKVTLNADPERTVIIPITTTDQDGASSSDYSGVPPSITFVQRGRHLEETITLQVKLTFGNTLPTGVSAGTTNEAVVTHHGRRRAVVSVSFEQADYTVVEGSTETVTVTLNADPERTVIIPITTTDQGGASSSDYSGVPANVTFVPGDTEETITFSATQDQDNDDGESVKLTFGNTLPTGVSAGNTDEAVVSITDDDVPSVSVSFEQADYTVVEGSTETVTVTLNADPERTVIIPITNTDQDGASSSDYSGVPPSITFNAGDTSKTFRFRPLRTRTTTTGRA